MSAPLQLLQQQVPADAQHAAAVQQGLSGLTGQEQDLLMQQLIMHQQQQQHLQQQQLAAQGMLPYPQLPHLAVSTTRKAALQPRSSLEPLSPRTGTSSALTICLSTASIVLYSKVSCLWSCSILKQGLQEQETTFVNFYLTLQAFACVGRYRPTYIKTSAC